MYRPKLKPLYDFVLEVLQAIEVEVPPADPGVAANLSKIHTYFNGILLRTTFQQLTEAINQGLVDRVSAVSFLESAGQLCRESQDVSTLHHLRKFIQITDTSQPNLCKAAEAGLAALFSSEPSTSQEPKATSTMTKESLIGKQLFRAAKKLSEPQIARSKEDLTDCDLMMLRPILTQLYQTTLPGSEVTAEWESRFYDAVFTDWDSSMGVFRVPIMPPRKAENCWTMCGDFIVSVLTSPYVKDGGVPRFDVFRPDVNKKMPLDFHERLIAGSYSSFERQERTRCNEFNKECAIFLVRQRIHYWLHVTHRFAGFEDDEPWVPKEPMYALPQLQKLCSELEHQRIREGHLDTRTALEKGLVPNEIPL